ncbi:MAG: CHAD domain-containing protein, partial [Acidimicrobiales bacterium]
HEGLDLLPADFSYRHMDLFLDDDLHSAAFAAVLDDWRATLATLADTLDDDEAGEWGDWPGEAGRRLADAAAQRVKAQHRKLLRAGCRIDADSPATDLHELRKDGKELRYLLELFGALLNRERVGPFVKTLKGLQDVLGEFQDTEVQVHALRRWADELASAGGVGTATLLAMGELIERLQGRQAVARAAFTERFTRFAAAGRP